MVVEVADRHQVGQLLDAAVMIGVPVRDDEMIDRLEARCGGSLVDALGVAVAGIAAVDQHRLALRRDEQRVSAALDIDEDDVQAAFLLGPARGQRRRQEASRKRTTIAKHRQSSSGE